YTSLLIQLLLILLIFFFHDPTPTEIYTLSLHDALPISRRPSGRRRLSSPRGKVPSWRSRNYPRTPSAAGTGPSAAPPAWARTRGDRKSTRLNSSHVKISYAVFCLKKKKK